MHKGKYVFAQLLDFIDKDVFLRIANKYDGNRYVKHFTCWNQLAVLMFGHMDGMLTGKKYPDKIRRVVYWDAESKRKFWGETENAVRIQIYSAITAYCMMAIVQK